MAKTRRFTDLLPLTAVNSSVIFPVVNVSDTSLAPTGSNRQMSFPTLSAYMQTLVSSASGDISSEILILQSNVSVLSADVYNLQTNVGTLSTNMDTLSSDVGTLSSAVITLSSQWVNPPATAS